MERRLITEGRRGGDGGDRQDYLFSSGGGERPFGKDLGPPPLSSADQASANTSTGRTQPKRRVETIPLRDPPLPPTFLQAVRTARPASGAPRESVCRCVCGHHPPTLTPTPPSPFPQVIAHPGCVWALCFTLQGGDLVTGSSDAVTRVWTTDPAKQVWGGVCVN